jgi:hypothetical protein
VDRVPADSALPNQDGHPRGEEFLD